jgi:hypothetical protein
VKDETKQALGDAVEKTIEAAEDTVQRPGVKRLAILGFYTKGFLFVVIGSLAIMLVAGIGGKIADPRGALATVAKESFGKALLIVFIVGAVGHGIWNILRGAADVDNIGGGWRGAIIRIVSIGIGIFYLGLALSAFEIVTASTVIEESSQVEETFIAVLLAIPVLGAVVLSLVGVCVIAAGVNECYSGLSGKFRENYRLWEIKGIHLAFISVLGVLSFTARALLLGIMGYFFIRAALMTGANGSIGLDAALLALLSSGFGRFLVIFTAAGLVAHGALAFYEARYRRIC